MNSSYRIPIAILATLILAVTSARMLEASRLPFSYPKGPAAIFYQGVLIVGSGWVLLCSLLLLLGAAQSWLLRRRHAPDLWDRDLDNPAPIGDIFVIDDTNPGPIWDRDHDLRP